MLGEGTILWGVLIRQQDVVGAIITPRMPQK